jgi:hypothetical protein
MTGPTTTGSIDAKLTIDKSEWDVKVAEAKADARELGALSPTVKVDANVGPAMAKLAELEAVERGLEATSVRLTVAEKGLNQEQAHSTSAALRLATVEKILSEAFKDTTGAAQRHAVAEEASAAATEAAGDSAGRAAVKISSVAVAEQRLETAQRQAANSASTAYIANERLTSMREKGAASALQLASAEEAAARADRNAEAAEKKHLAAIAALNVAKSEAAAKSLEQAAATDNDTASTNRNVQANNRRVSGMQVLIAMAPLILSAAAPVAAAAVGLGAAFTVMGVSGAFAIKGIQDSMEAGNSTGNAYAAGLGSIKGNLDDLAGTAANGMLSAFSSAIGDINSRMPFLTQMTGQFSSMLGQIGGGALRGILTGLEQMNPLIQVGGIELGKFVGWLTSFNGTTGFNEFITYAVNNLPSVMQLIESLVTTAGHIMAAFAPLGPVVVGALQGISDVLNGLPLPVLAGLVTTAVALSPALRIAGAAMALFAIESQLAVPVVGIFTALLAGIGIAAATSALGTGQGTASITEYGNAVERDNGLIGENVRLQAAHAATTKEMRDAADSLGISTQAVMQAMLGNKESQDAVNGAMNINTERIAANQRGGEGMLDTAERLTNAKNTLTGGISSNTSAIQTNVDAFHAYKDVTEQTTPAITAQTTAAQLLAGQYGTSVASYQAAQSAQDQSKVSTDNQTVAMQLQNDAAGLLKMTLDGLNGKALSAAQAQNAFDSSLVNMGDHVSATGKKIHFTTTSIEDMSSASVALRGQLNGQVTNLQSVVEANGGLSESTGKAREQMVTMRQQIIDNAVAHGVDEAAVTAYVDGLLAIPKTVPPTKLDINATEAELKIAGFQSAIDRLTGKTIHIYSVEHIQQVRDSGDNAGANSMDTANQYATGNAYRSEGGPIYRAAGGPVNYLAFGGHPGGPRGTDTVPAWLTPDEFVMKRASSKSIGPAALNYMNTTGQLPPASAGAGNITVYIGNEAIDSHMVRVVQEGIDGVARQIGGMRR